MNSKNEILNRLRQVKNSVPKNSISQWEDKDLFNDFPNTSDNLIDIFKYQLEKLSGDVYVVYNKEEMVKTLRYLLEKVKPDQCKTHRCTLIDELKRRSPEIRDYLTDIDELDLTSEEYAKFEVGISAADCLIARTGSILLRAHSSGGRRLSVLPPIHIVIAEAKQIVASLDEAFHFLDLNQNTWSYATIISGPSRTSDIEKQLVLGAHGPKKLIVILLND
jgi:L-lactate dehydrogenase complex protein LldG